MTEQGFNKWLENQPVEDMIVALKYKYSHEKAWTYSNEILEVDPSGEYIWQNDWNEGQTEVEVIGCIPISEIDVPKFKTEPNCSEKPNNCEVKNYCDNCLYTDTCDSKEFFYACTSKATREPKTEPQTDKSMAVGKRSDATADKYNLYGKTTTDEPQTCDTCTYGQEKHRYAHICNECGVGINNYTPQTERSE